MSFGRHVCCRHFRLNAPKNHVWISVELLNNALHPFAAAKVPRRHVGLAPGPLESRKRATRRRMMNLAQDGRGEGGFDPNLLPGGGSADYMEWKWQSPRPVTPHRPAEVAPLPSWLTDPTSTEFDLRLDSLEKEESVKTNEEVEASERHHVLLRRKNPLSVPAILEHFEKCMDVDGLHDWAATYCIDVRKYAKLLFTRLCHDGKPLPFLLHALEDAGLRYPRNFQDFLELRVHAVRSHGGGEPRRLTPDDMALLQQWMTRQLYFGLRSEKDILLFSRFVYHVSFTTIEKSSLCNLIASFQSLQSSSVLRFSDLGTSTRRQIIRLIARGPATRQLLDMGISFSQTIPSNFGRPRRVFVFIRKVIHAHLLRHQYGEQVNQFPELITTILETVFGLPTWLRDSVILITTKALIHDHCRMFTREGPVMQLPDLWLSAIAKKMNSGDLSVKVKVETFLGTLKSGLAVPYLQQLDERKQACFILRHWFGYRSPSGHSRAQLCFDLFYSGKRKESPWVSMLQAAKHYAYESLGPLDFPMKRIFKTLQVLGQSRSIVDIVKQWRKLKDIVDANDLLYIIEKHLEEQPHIAERVFHFYPGLRLEHCPRLAERMILDTDSHPLNALRYARRHSPHILLHPQRTSRECIAQRRTQLLRRMARSYSLALHIPPRLAFRRVYRCYAQHMKERLGPLPVAAARAFTQAGLIRAFQAGQCVNTTTIRWILSIIRSTEGADVADRVKIIVYNWREANLR